MKFRVTMKDPDTLHDAIVDAVKVYVQALQLSDEAEAQAVVDVRVETVREVCRRWFEHGEYLSVDVDTEAKTCAVVPVRR